MSDDQRNVLPFDERSQAARLFRKIQQLPPEQQQIAVAAIDTLTLLERFGAETRPLVLELLGAFQQLPTTVQRFLLDVLSPVDRDPEAD